MAQPQRRRREGEEGWMPDKSSHNDKNFGSSQEQASHSKKDNFDLIISITYAHYVRGIDNCTAQ